MSFPISSLTVNRLVLKHTLLGQQIVTVLDFCKDPNNGGAFPDGPPQSSAFLTTFRDIWVAQVLPLSTLALRLNSLSLTSIVGWDFGAAPGLQPKPRLADTDELIDGNVGTSVIEPLPSFAAVTGRKRTALAGRKWRGSCRIPGVVETATDAADGNLLTVAAAGAYQTAWNACCASFRPDIPGAPLSFMRMVVFSLRRLAEATVVPGNYATWQYAQTLTSSPINKPLGTQVSRKVGHGS